MANHHLRAWKFTAAFLLAAGSVGVQAQEPEGLPLSAQLYTARDAGTLDQQFAVIEQAGIKYVEPFRFFGMQEVPVEEMKAALSRHHLKVSGMHINFGDLADNLKHTVEYNKAIGNTRLIVPAFSATMTPHDKAGWQALGGVMETIAKTLKPEGMKIGFHNHIVEMEVIEGKTALEWFAEAAPDVIITVDCAWAAQGGQDPAQLLRRLKGHVWNIHVKDNAPAGTAKDQRGLATVGKGVLNWDSILKAAHESGVQWFTLEHDVPKPDAVTVLKEGSAYIAPRLQKLLGI
jgi:sugar phosphate isomerase/epimerase